MILGYENGKNEYEIPVGDEHEYIDGSYQIGGYELAKLINKKVRCIL